MEIKISGTASIITVLIMTLFCCLPVAAQSLQGDVEKSSATGDNTLVNPGDFNNPVLFQLQPRQNHGEAPVGVLGAAMEAQGNLDSGTILTVYPDSDLVRFGIQSGDRLICVDGHPYPMPIRMSQDLCRGVPGTYMTMEILHAGRILCLQIKRTDARLHARYDYSSDHYFQWCASQTRRW